MGSTYAHVLLHVVFSTKHRRPLIDEGIRERLWGFMGGIVRDEGGTLCAIGGVQDHVHLLVRWKTDAAIADLVRHVKSRSSRWVHATFVEQEFGWQDGYSVFSVSQSQYETVRRYIHNQAEHHRQRAFESELEALLRAHGVEYDPRYVFD